MKQLKWTLVLFSILVWGSCTKDESPVTADGMVKTVDSVTMDAQFGLIQLDDGQYIALCNGQIVKLDGRGNVAWKKPIPEFSYVRAAVAIPGTGYALLGISSHPQTNSSLYACRYDQEGNFLDGKQVNINFPNIYLQLPVSLIRLSNGGFALAMSSSWTYVSYLKILDSDFNLVYSSAIEAPAGYYAFSVQHCCEMPGGDIALAGTIGGGGLEKSYINYAAVLTEPNGIIKSYTLVGDSTYNNMTLAMSPYPGGFFVTTSTMTGWNTVDGSFVNYYGGTTIAGSMQIDRFNSEGEFTGSRAMSGYPGYGVIKTIRQTPDGGYLLCGTVGNLGSSVSVSMTRVYVCKLSSGLNAEWSRSVATTYQAIGVDAVPSLDGSCLVTGNLKSFDKGYQMLMIKTDANGNY